MLHAANAALQGYKRILIIANDTDVTVLGVSFFTEISAEKLWVSFGMCYVMSPLKVYALPAFHALTGCDNTSFFSGMGKKSAYGKWSTRPDLTTTLCHLMEKPLTISSEDIKVIVFLTLFCNLPFDRSQPSLPANICSVISHISN